MYNKNNKLTTLKFKKALDDIIIQAPKFKGNEAEIPKFLCLTKDLNFLIIGSNTLDIKIFDVQNRKVVK